MNKLYLNYRDANYNQTRLLFEPNYNFSMFEKRRAYVTEVEQLLKPYSPKTMIDYGAGDGTNTPHFDNCDMYTYDISNVKSLIKKTSTLFQCDLITCMQVLEHVPDPNIILEEIKSAKALYYYFEVPNEDTTKPKEFWHEHINFFNLESFTKLLSKYFTIIYSDAMLHVRVICTI